MSSATDTAEETSTSAMPVSSFIPTNNLANGCLLLDLPPELRNHIFHAVSLSGDDVTIRKGIPVPHALARTCRQLRSEFFPVLRSHEFANGTTFHFHVNNFEFWPVICFTRAIMSKWDADPEACYALKIKLTLAPHMGMNNYDYEVWLHACDQNTYLRPFTRTYDIEFKRGVHPQALWKTAHDFLDKYAGSKGVEDMLRLSSAVNKAVDKLRRISQVQTHGMEMHVSGV